MNTIEVELWNIFTCYTLHGSPRDPSRMNETQFLKLCKDSSVMNPTMVDIPLNQATLHLIWTSEQKNSKSSGSSESDRLGYREFLSCLIGVASRCYPNCTSSEDSMQQLLMDNILPMAARRRPVSLASFMTQPLIEELFEYYQEALQEIFRYYANNSDNISRNMIKSTAPKSKTFDEQKSLIAEARERNQTPNLYCAQMSYAEFLAFASDFGLASSMALTTLDLGDIFLTVISTQGFETTLRGINFREFWEVLARCALVAFRQSKDISTEDKLKGMFLYLWRHMQHSIHSTGGNSTSKSAAGGFTIFQGELLRGSKILNEKFIMAWNKDGFRDYLDSEQQQKDSNRSPSVEDGIINRVIGMTISKSFPEKKKTCGSENYLESGESQISVHINDSDDLNDERIQPNQLRKLLLVRPDLRRLLYDCIVNEGLDKLEDDEEDV